MPERASDSPARLSVIRDGRAKDRRPSRDGSRPADLNGERAAHVTAAEVGKFWPPSPDWMKGNEGEE